MEIFPTQYSVLSSLALGLRLERSYGLTDLYCKLLIHNVSDTYLAENGNSKYIFKIYRDSHRKKEEILAETELLLLLKEQGVRVAFPIADLQGNYLQSFHAAEGTRYGVLFSFARGKVIPDLKKEHLTAIGVEMARFHEVSSKAELSEQRKEYTIENLLTGPLRTIKPAFTDELQQEYEWLAEMTEQTAAVLRELDLSRFSYGYCHYDFLPKNFHFDELGQLTFFDFDFAGKGLLVNDLASFYIHFFLEVYTGKITAEQAEEQFGIFIAAYRTIRPVSDEEMNAIPYFGFAFWIFYFGFHYENFEDWSNFFFGPKFIRERVKLIKTWTEWYCKF